jgi:hypothetical protein
MRCVAICLSFILRERRCCPIAPRLTQNLGLDTDVEDLLRRREAVLEVDSANVAHLLAESDIEGILRGGQSGERRLQIVRLDVDDREVPAGGRLNPDGLASDAVART